MLMRTKLVGRERELAALEECLEDAVEGRPRLVVCQGEPGIGKTRLAEELLGLADAKGVASGWGVAVDPEGAPPYWPWREVLRGVGNRVDLTAVAAEHRLINDLAQLAPDMFAGSADLGGAGALVEDRFRLFDAVAMLLRQMTCREPLVVVLDDMHSADHVSMLLLQHVARSLRDERLLVVVNSRDTEQLHGAMLAELLRNPVMRQVRLRGLEPRAVGQQLTSVLGHDVCDADVAHVHELTGGNPFLIAEVGRTWTDRHDGFPTPVVTADLREAIAARLSRLSADTVTLLQAASIVGREFSATVVAAMLGQSMMDCLGLLDQAAAAGLVEVPTPPGEHRFTHALIRDAIEAGLGTPERVRLHRLAAGAVEEIFSDRVEAHVFDLARHWAVASMQGDRAIATGWIEQAAAEAMRQHAYEEAARLFRLALDVGAGELDQLGRCRLLLELGTALQLSSNVPGCLQVCLEAAAVARDIGRSDLVAQAALVPEPTIFLPDADLVIRQLCEQALAVLDPSRTALRGQVTARLAEVCMYLCDDETARTASEEALTLAEECGDQATLLAALKSRQEVCSSPDSLEERAELAERMLAVGREPPSPEAELSGHLWRIDTALERGDLSVVAWEIEAAARCAQQLQGRLARWLLLRTQCVLAQAQARFDDAHRLAVEAFTTIGPLNEPSAPIVWAGFMGATAHQVGHDTESLASQGLADATADELDFPTVGVIRALAPAWVLAEVGRVSEAAAIYRSLGPVADWRPTPHATLFTYAFGINLAIMLGASDDVATLHDRLASYRGHHVVSGVCSVAYFGPVELWLGVAAAHLDLLDDAVADLEHAAKACAVSGAAGFHAEAQYELANVLALRAGPGDLTRARSLATESARQAQALGMAPIAAKATSLIEHLHDAGPSLPLTRREREVAELVAQGLTNREIATRLYLSERTAQNHVQHILDKLDLPNRSQIAVLISNKK